MVQMMIDHPEAGSYDISSVRLLAYGGSVISEAVLKRAMEFFPDAEFVQVYGMTEMSPCMTYLSTGDHRSNKPGILRSAGRANLTTQVRIVDSQGGEVPCGTVGEVAASGPGVMLGYWNKPEQTAAAVRNGWMHTGDGGLMDEDGYLFIVDRVKDMIVSGGENVYSAEVENALAQHPAVAISAVFGIPSEQWGEAVHAVVVLARQTHPRTAHGSAAGVDERAVNRAPLSQTNVNGARRFRVRGDRDANRRRLVKSASGGRHIPHAGLEIVNRERAVAKVGAP